MHFIYFAWVREIIGKSGETLDPPTGVGSVEDLLNWLAGQGETYGEALANRGRIRVAVNQVFAGPGDPVKAGDEVAIFPPVTGG